MDIDGTVFHKLPIMNVFSPWKVRLNWFNFDECVMLSKKCYKCQWVQRDRGLRNVWGIITLLFLV